MSVEDRGGYEKDLGSTCSPSGGEEWEEQKGMCLRGLLVGGRDS